MNSIIIFIIICCIYYYLYKEYNEYLEDKYHYYFGAFVGIYLLILYIYHFEYPFFYRLLKNIYDTKNQPLYTFDSINSNSELFKSQNPNGISDSFEGFNIKETLLTKQGYRCHACSNFLMKEDINNCKLKYKTPLQNGGQNHIENIGLLCPQCYQFK